VVISIKSMKLAQDSFRTVAALLHKDWISLEDIQMKISSLKRHHSMSQRSSMIIENKQSSALLLNSGAELAPVVEIDDNRVCCFCCCCQPRQSTKRDNYKPVDTSSNDLVIANNANANFNSNIIQGSCEQVSLVVTCQPRGSLSGSQEFVTGTTNGGGGGGEGTLRKVTDQRVSELRMREVRDSSVENLRSVADSIQSRSQQLYALLSDTSSPTHSHLLRSVTYVVFSFSLSIK